MKLIYSPTSPYARKTRVVTRVADLKHRIEEMAICPFSEKETLIKTNPLGKVPALILENGEVLYDSGVICDYLNNLGEGTPLWPDEYQSEYWKIRVFTELGNGIMDAAFSLVMEQKRPLSEQSEQWKDNYTSSLLRAVKSANAETDFFDSGFRMDTITLGCALGYLDFRLDNLNWRKENEQLAAWYNDFSEHQFMKDTMPPQG